jgi:SAM-dependent methyltransferase
MPSERPAWAPPSIDLDHPNAARIYDYLLGGACNFAQDRAFAQKLLELIPDAECAARNNRAFLRRAVRYCITQGIRQFLDLGSGIPTVGNVHEVAQEMDPECRVLYVDIEPVAVAHRELILEDNDRAGALRADLCDVDTVLTAAASSPILDFGQPIAALVTSVLQFVPDAAQPHRVVAEYVRAVQPGSFLVLSHATTGVPVQRRDEIADLYNKSRMRWVGRTHDQISAFFAGTELVEPGLVWTPQWRPDSPEDLTDHPERSLFYAGVGRKR